MAALAPRASLRSMVLLLSHGKPRLNSLFSSISTTATPATDTPVGPADQAPPRSVPRSGSTYRRSFTLGERVHHRLPEDPLAAARQTRAYKRSSEKHPNNPEVCEDPDLGVAEGGPRISDKDKPKHKTPEPVGRRTGMRNDAIHKHSILDASCSSSTLQPLPDKLRKDHPDHSKVREDGDLPGRRSSRNNPQHPVHEPKGRISIAIANRPPPGRSSSHDDPKHPVHEPKGRTSIATANCPPPENIDGDAC